MLAVGAATLVVARTLQFDQIWMIGAALVVAVAVAAVAVMRRPNGVMVSCRLQPAALQVGTPAEVVVDIAAGGARRVPTVVVTSGERSWRLASMAPGAQHRLRWSLATSQRGVVMLPAVEIQRRDPLGLARRTSVAYPPIDVVVAPRTVPLAMVQMGVGALGLLLMHRARQFGVGEFEGLRHYVEGDDLRLVHWKASARSTDLLVKQFSLEGARRCTVVVDTATSCDPTAFETGISIAASVVEAAYQADWAVRLATTAGVDVGGGSGLNGLRRTLAGVAPQSSLQLPGRDPDEGVGLLVCITPSLDSELWRRRDQFSDPAMVTMAVSLTGAPDSTVIDGSTLDIFAQAWQRRVAAAPADGSRP
jgi:uncharacterized protein (DUF58 family)